jgi:hypothetical protein
MPIGFRKELSTVRHYELNLARDRARLQDEELEVSHQLADAVRLLELNYELTQTNFNRTLAADRQVEAVQAAFEAETVTLDQLLEAQRRRAEAQTSYFRTLLDYQRAIIGVHFRKGSLLEYNNVYLQEGPWPAKAQFDAHRLARQRDASVYLNYGFTRPVVSSQGPIRQLRPGEEHGAEGLEGYPMEEVPYEAAPPHELPAPEAGAAQRPAASEVPGLAAPARLRPASSPERGFEWGPLGMASDRLAQDESAGDAGAPAARQVNYEVEDSASNDESFANQPTRSASRDPAVR